MVIEWDRDLIEIDLIKLRIFFYNPFDAEIWDRPNIFKTCAGWWLSLGPLDLNIPPKEAR